MKPSWFYIGALSQNSAKETTNKTLPSGTWRLRVVIRHNSEKDHGNPGWEVSAPQKDSPRTSVLHGKRPHQAGRRQPAKGTEREHFFHYILKPLNEENWDQIKGNTVSGLR